MKTDTAPAQSEQPQPSAGRDSVGATVRQSPRQRFETALKALSDPLLRLKVRRIWETEMEGCSVFWDKSERQIELVGNTHEIIIREHSMEEMWSGYSGVKTVSPNTSMSNPPSGASGD